MLQKDKTVLGNYGEAVELEWLETNGLGGWSGSSIIHCNTRRYHGLLIAAIQPPTERANLVSKLDETLVIGENRFELGTNNYGTVIFPTGYHYLTSFSKQFFPEFIYEAAGITLRKTIAMVHDENTTLVIYDVLKAPQSFSMELLPMLAVRGYHSLTHANDVIQQNVHFDNHTFHTKPYTAAPDIYITVPGGNYQHNPHWYYNFSYSIEQQRGLDFNEDLFSPGKILVDLKEGDSIGVIISTENTTEKNAHDLLSKEKLRRQALLKDQPTVAIIQTLTLAADQFIVKREPALKSVIAGYHWFTDWARDTMISLPGLCLSTGRYDDAKKILIAFAHSVSMGMLPNRFQDSGRAPEYNTVDGTLWYFIAIYKYLQATQDRDFVLKELLPVLGDIIDWHYKGTRYHIHVAEDGLLYSGEPGVQLTWMDAKVGDWVVTPRTGKAVEVNALWYNVLCIYAELLALKGNKTEAALVNAKAAYTKENFIQQFWNEKAGYLYDVIGELKDDTFRPNQLFTISLPFPLIENEKAERIVSAVTERLYTPVGLRTLPPDHPAYIGVYGGTQLQRDASYHQGIAWSWLLGPYIDAFIRAEGMIMGRKHAQLVIDNFRYHLAEDGIGSVSEIFDGDAPHHPRGCVAQAWGVAEILRVIKQYGLYEGGVPSSQPGKKRLPKKKKAVKSSSS